MAKRLRKKIVGLPTYHVYHGPPSEFAFPPSKLMPLRQDCTDNTLVTVFIPIACMPCIASSTECSPALRWPKCRPKFRGYS